MEVTSMAQSAVHTRGNVNLEETPASPNGHQRAERNSIAAAEHLIPRLQAPGAWTVARDRWERLETTVVIPADASDVWRALTDPDVLKQWLAVCHGSFAQTDRDWVLDFEDGEFFLGRSTTVLPST